MSEYLTPAAGDWISAPIPDGGRWTWAYPEIGTFLYFANHAPSIMGKVIVRSDADKMIHVSAGEFKMGCNIVNDPNCYSDEIPLHSVNLDGYYIDKYEVTNARYRKCVETGPCAPPVLARSYLRPSYYDNEAFSAYPMVYVDWFQAAAFCAWEGKRLPTEA